MNKAFVREPEFDGRAYCPRCGALGVSVGRRVLDEQISEAARQTLGESAWFCAFPRCEVAYFDLFEAFVPVANLKRSVYPKDPDAPVCACFGFTLDEIEADVRDGTPTRIRELLARSRSPEARCQTAAADGQCCMREVQRVYLKRRGE